MTLFTIGHSTRPLEELIDLLRAHRIKNLADVRTIPRSRRNPQFNQESLEKTLPDAGIAYHWFKGLGGLRHAKKDSANLGWRNASFRGYADYLQTEAFETSLDELLALARRGRTAVMCAEAVPWRCHRSLIADAVTCRGIEVRHILSEKKADLHRLTPFARLEDGRLVYPAPKTEQAQFKF